MYNVPGSMLGTFSFNNLFIITAMPGEKYYCSQSSIFSALAAGQLLHWAPLAEVTKDLLGAKWDKHFLSLLSKLLMHVAFSPSLHSSISVLSFFLSFLFLPHFCPLYLFWGKVDESLHLQQYNSNKINIDFTSLMCHTPVFFPSKFT